MARRREYVSFFSDSRGRRREFRAFDRRRRVSAIVVPVLVLAVLSVAIWWFSFRDTDLASEGITLEDSDIPSILFPTEGGGQPAAAGPQVTCVDEAVEWATFQGTASRTGCTTARTITNPIILWQQPVGVQGWLNNPVITDGRIIVGSAGDAQGSRDNADGVYAFDLATGERQWFFGAELDVNGVGLAGEAVIATGDEGRVWALLAESGRLVWSHDLEAPTFGNPLTVGDLTVIGDRDGRLTAYDVRTEEMRWQQQLNGPVRGGAASNGEVIVANSESREVLAVDLNGNELWRVTVLGSEPGAANSRLWAAPTIVGDLVILGRLRDDMYIEPAMVALRLSDGTVAWEASDAAGIASEWGNVRSSPAAVEGLLLYGQTFSNLLVAVDTELGDTLWSVEVGEYCVQHWSSPAVVGDLVILPRQDGAVYAVSISSRELVWSIYIGRSDSGGLFPDDYGPLFCDPLPEDAAPIQASPAIAPDGTIIIGTLDGRLIAIGDRDW